jgi:hypothetical protein
MKKKMSKKQVLAESVGWYGAVAILAAYALVSFNIISGNGLIFQLLNLTGAIGIIAIASYKKVRQSIVLNIFWGIVAIVAIIRIYI